MALKKKKYKANLVILFQQYFIEVWCQSFNVLYLQLEIPEIKRDGMSKKKISGT